jgi:hypothetical protein
LNVLPTLEFWSLAKNAEAPLIEATWGETFQPPVFRVYGFDVFNPYAVGCANSERFLDWQFNRATNAVYGRPLPRDKNMNWMEGHVVVTSLRTQVMNIVTDTGIAIVIMAAVLVFDWHRFRRLAGFARVSVMCLAALGGSAVMLVAIDNTDPAQWLSWALPQSLPAAIAIAVLCLGALYRALETLFGQIEIVDKGDTPAA